MKATQAEIDAFLAQAGVVAGPVARFDDAPRIDGAHSAIQCATLDANEATIPLPISTNHIWRSIIAYARGRPVVKVLKTKKYREWIKDVLPLVKHMTTRDKPAVVEIEICGTNQRPDLDNFAKAPIDLLRQAGVLKGDNIKHVRRLVVFWSADKIDGKEVAIIRLTDASL